jgi:hypothetical protein
MAEDTATSGQQSSSQDRPTPGTQHDPQSRAAQAAGRDRRRVNV